MSGEGAPGRKVRQGHLHERRWCGVCGTELPPYGGVGRPHAYCRPDTGRPCARLVETISALRSQIDTVAANVPPNRRESFLRTTRGTLRTIVQDLTLTVAQLDGDTDRAGAVGRKDPKGFED